MVSIRTPITRPLKRSPAVCIRITAIAIIDMLCTMPASVRHPIATGMLCIREKISSMRYQAAAV